LGTVKLGHEKSLMTNYQVRIILEKGGGALNFIRKFDFGNAEDVEWDIFKKMSVTLDKTDNKNEWLVQLTVNWDDGEKEYLEFPYKTNIKSDDKVALEVFGQLRIQVLKLS